MWHKQLVLDATYEHGPNPGYLILLEFFVAVLMSTRSTSLVFSRLPLSCLVCFLYS